MSPGSVFLATALAGAAFVALVDLLAARRFRGPAYAAGLSLGVTSISMRPWASVAQGCVVTSPHGEARIESPSEVRLRSSSLFLVVGTVYRGAAPALCDVRLAPGGPCLLVFAALLLGHLAGKANPALAGSLRVEFVLCGLGALGVLVAVAWGVADARRRTAHLLAWLVSGPESVARGDDVGGA